MTEDINPYVDKVVIYMDGKAEYRWRAQAGNNRILADSGEGYVNRADAVEAAKNIFPDLEPEEQ